MHLQVLSKAGSFPIRMVGFPGIQGAVVIGIQGMGVNTPNAAAVAAATVGFAKELHIPKGIIFTIGLLSIIVAAGNLAVVTRFTGNTFSTDGATPKVQVICALVQAIFGIVFLLNIIGVKLSGSKGVSKRIY